MPCSKNLSEARSFADRIRDLGCQLALDDFGSGYASFRYLRLFPIDLVKIDGEYVVDLVRNPEDQVLVRALVQVCQAYGIHTVAEYVQDEATLRMLRELWQIRKAWRDRRVTLPVAEPVPLPKAA